jgi:hypothetical protein
MGLDLERSDHVKVLAAVKFVPVARDTVQHVRVGGFVRAERTGEVQIQLPTTFWAKSHSIVIALSGHSGSANMKDCGNVARTAHRRSIATLSPGHSAGAPARYWSQRHEDGPV